MALFAKKTCHHCGTESRLMTPIKSKNGPVHLCDKCKAALHIEGYINYSLYVLRKEASFEALMNYSSYYDTVIEEAKHFRNNRFDTALIDNGAALQTTLSKWSNTPLNAAPYMGSYRYNALFLTSHQYKDLLIRRSDVYLIAYSTDHKATNKFKNSGDSLTTAMLFSHSPVVPYLPTISISRNRVFDLLRKMSTENAMEGLSVFYPGVQISSSKDLRKQLRSGTFVPSFDKKKMDDILFNIECNSSYCKGEILINEINNFKSHAEQLNTVLGFTIPKEEF